MPTSYSESSSGSTPLRNSREQVLAWRSSSESFIAMVDGRGQKASRGRERPFTFRSPKWSTVRRPQDCGVRRKAVLKYSKQNPVGSSTRPRIGDRYGNGSCQCNQISRHCHSDLCRRHRCWEQNGTAETDDSPALEGPSTDCQREGSGTGSDVPRRQRVDSRRSLRIRRGNTEVENIGNTATRLRRSYAQQVISGT